MRPQAIRATRPPRLSRGLGQDVLLGDCGRGQRQHTYHVIQPGVPRGSRLTLWDEAVPSVTEETSLPRGSLVAACRAWAPEGLRQFVLP